MAGREAAVSLVVFGQDMGDPGPAQPLHQIRNLVGSHRNAGERSELERDAQQQTGQTAWSSHTHLSFSAAPDVES